MNSINEQCRQSGEKKLFIIPSRWNERAVQRNRDGGVWSLEWGGSTPPLSGDLGTSVTPHTICSPPPNSAGRFRHPTRSAVRFASVSAGSPPASSIRKLSSLGNRKVET
nr:hypothetical protein Iba_chr11aCG18570 [Ipomoea batatas]